MNINIINNKRLSRTRVQLLRLMIVTKHLFANRLKDIGNFSNFYFPNEIQYSSLKQVSVKFITFISFNNSLIFLVNKISDFYFFHPSQFHKISKIFTVLLLSLLSPSRLNNGTSLSFLCIRTLKSFFFDVNLKCLK